jgi:hypothetical protein
MMILTNKIIIFLSITINFLVFHKYIKSFRQYMHSFYALVFFARCIDILLNGGFTAAGRYHVAAAEPTENITTHLPTDYLASLFGRGTSDQCCLSL